MRFQFDADSPYTQNGRFNWESQNLYLGLSYRFGSGKNRAKGRKRKMITLKNPVEDSINFGQLE